MPGGFSPSLHERGSSASMVSMSDTLHVSDAPDTAGEKEIGTAEEAEAEQIYELGYLLSPSLSEESVLEEVGQIRSLITGRDGAVLGEGSPKLVHLAYRMEKTLAHRKQVFETAFFGWIKCSISPTCAEEIARLLKEREHLIRFLLVKSALDAALPSRPVRVAPPKRKPETPQTLDEAALERELEELLSE